MVCRDANERKGFDEVRVTSRYRWHASIKQTAVEAGQDSAGFRWPGEPTREAAKCTSEAPFSGTLICLHGVGQDEAAAACDAAEARGARCTMCDARCTMQAEEVWLSSRSTRARSAKKERNSPKSAASTLVRPARVRRRVRRRVQLRVRCRAADPGGRLSKTHACAK